MLLRNLQGGHFYWDTVYVISYNERNIPVCCKVHSYQISLKSVNIWLSNCSNKKGAIFDFWNTAAKNVLLSNCVVIVISWFNVPNSTKIRSFSLRKTDTTIFTAQCYAERGIATASRLSVCLSISVTLRYRDHIGWKSLQIISRSVSLGFSLFTDPKWRI